MANIASLAEPNQLATSNDQPASYLHSCINVKKLED